MKKILIIEDEESILMALEDNLQLEGYEVACAVDGEQGLLMAKEQKFDLLILDIMLPKMDGFEVCKQLRKDGINTPILTSGQSKGPFKEGGTEPPGYRQIQIRGNRSGFHQV